MTPLPTESPGNAHPLGVLPGTPSTRPDLPLRADNGRPLDQTEQRPTAHGGRAQRSGNTVEGPALTFIAHGIPKPKGSMKHIGHGRMKEQVDNAPWRDSIIWAAVSAMPSPDPLTGPLRIDATFTFPKPASAPKRRASWPMTRTSGDLDKHCRLLCDALQAAGAIVDDSQVTELHAAKRFTGEGVDALTFPGVVVRVWRIGGGA